MCVDFDIRLFSDWKAEGIPLRQKKKKNVVAITFFFSELRCMYSVIDGYSNRTDDRQLAKWGWYD